MYVASLLLTATVSVRRNPTPFVFCCVLFVVARSQREIRRRTFCFVLRCAVAPEDLVHTEVVRLLLLSCRTLGRRAHTNRIEK